MIVPIKSITFGGIAMLINTDLIILDLPARTKEETINMLSKRAYEVGRVSDLQAYIKAVLEKEKQYSTGVGFGVAIPHGKTDAVNEPFLMFARVKPMVWQSLDDDDVDLIFAIGVPEKDAADLHIEILAKISRKIMKADFRKALRKLHTEDEILKLLELNELM